MAVLTGKNGKIKVGGVLVHPMTEWKLKMSSKNKEYVASDSANATQREAGNTDCSGSFKILVKTEGVNCPVEEGQKVTLQCHVDATEANYYEVPVIIDDIDVTTDVNEAAIVSWDITFSGNGAVVKNGILAAAAGSS